jgi:hypothetical protein
LNTLPQASNLPTQLDAIFTSTPVELQQEEDANAGKPFSSQETIESWDDE